MKSAIRILFILSFLVCVGHESKGQYQKMLGDSNFWNVTFCLGPNCNTDFYKCVGDTVVNGKHYKFMDWFHFNRNLLVREDTIAQKVYFYFMWGYKQYQETLMYDFSLTTGQTTTIYNPNSPIPDSLGTYVVDSVGTMNTQLGPRKAIYLSREDPSSGEYLTTVWLEGVGGLSYINTPGQKPELFGFGELSCYDRDGIPVYRSQFSLDSNTCSLTKITVPNTPNSIAEEGDEQVQIFPNPFTNRIQVKSGNVELEHIEVIDLQGRTVFIEQVESMGTHDVNLQHLPNGTYFLFLKSKESIISRRIIKYAEGVE